MKILFSIITIVLLTAINATAQEQTLLGNDEISSGGFGGPVIKYSSIRGEDGILVGGRGGWILNHSFVIGGGGYGLVNNIKAPASVHIDQFGGVHTPYINFGYGGVELEYIIQSDRLLHFSVYTLIGGGTISYRDGLWGDNNSSEWNTPEDAFFVLEPEINVELNVVSFMRISAGAGYRFISGVDLNNLDNGDFSGFSGGLTLKFGTF